MHPLQHLWPLLDEMYAEVVRPGIPPERLLKAKRLPAFGTIRSETLPAEMPHCRLLLPPVPRPEPDRRDLGQQHLHREPGPPLEHDPARLCFHHGATDTETGASCGAAGPAAERNAKKRGVHRKTLRAATRETKINRKKAEPNSNEGVFQRTAKPICKMHTLYPLRLSGPGHALLSSRSGGQVLAGHQHFRAGPEGPKDMNSLRKQHIFYFSRFIPRFG